MTIETHRHERSRLVAWSGMSNAASTGVALIVSFVSMPLTVGYLGPERYGIWITISSLLAWLSVTDMGFGGAALVNALSHARGQDNTRMMHTLVSTAFFVLCGLALMLMLLFALTFPFVSWADVMNSHGMIATRELHLSIAIAFVSFALLFPLGICSAVYNSLQEGYIAHGWALVGNVCTLIALVIVTHQEGGLPLLVLALTASRTIILTANACHLFWYRHPVLRPSWRSISRTSFSRLARLGWKYLIQQLANIGMFQSQPIMITQFLGPAAVGIYNVAFRILSIPQTIVGMFLLPLVPAYGEARARNDWTWIWKMLRRSVAASVGLGLLVVIPLGFAAPPIIHHVISPELVPSTTLIVLISLYTLLTTAAAPFAVFFNGVERVGSMASIASMNAAMLVITALVMLPRFGLNGMAGAMAISYAATNLAGQFWMLKIFRQQFSRSNPT